MAKKNDYLIDTAEIRKLVHKNAESSFMHTTYREELERFFYLAQGDEKAVELSDYILNADLQGRLSEDPLRNMKYLFVVNTGLATRFAIESGAPQEVVYSSSDIYIRKADVAKSIEEILKLNHDYWVYLVGLVRESRKTEQYSKPVIKCIDYITSFFNTKVTLEDLSGVTGLSPNYLASLFKQETGMTVGEYMTRFRIDSACALLTQTDYDYLQIALSLGFCTQSYFTKVFREQTGVTPRTYRIKHTDKGFTELG